MSKKGIIFMVGAVIAAGFAGYKVGAKKHYCCLCDGAEYEPDGEGSDDQEKGNTLVSEAEARRIMDELMGKVRPELLAYIMCCGSDD